MAKNNKQEVTLTPSGHEPDKELARVPIKVSPSLQALIANQMDLIEMLEGKMQLSPIFVEQHKVEISSVEEEIAGAFSSYIKKKEKAKERRLQKKKQQEEAAITEKEFIPSTDEGIVSFPTAETANAFPSKITDSISPPVDRKEKRQKIEHTPDRKDRQLKEEPPYSQETNFELINGNTVTDNPVSGLPSAKYETESQTQPAVEDPTVDIRRVAIGASINALKGLLGRELTEEEIVSIEARVDSYLA